MKNTNCAAVVECVYRGQMKTNDSRMQQSPLLKSDSGWRMESSQEPWGTLLGRLSNVLRAAPCCLSCLVHGAAVRNPEQVPKTGRDVGSSMCRQRESDSGERTSRNCFE